MSTALVGMLLPSQRALLAKAYRDIATAYRSGFIVSELEGHAILAEMTAKYFEKDIDSTLTTNITRNPLWPRTAQTASTPPSRSEG